MQSFTNLTQKSLNIQRWKEKLLSSLTSKPSWQDWIQSRHTPNMMPSIWSEADDVKWKRLGTQDHNMAENPVQAGRVAAQSRIPGKSPCPSELCLCLYAIKGSARTSCHLSILGICILDKDLCFSVFFHWDCCQMRIAPWEPREYIGGSSVSRLLSRGINNTNCLLCILS